MNKQIAKSCLNYDTLASLKAQISDSELQYYVTYGIFVLLGCGFLFPYNSFITAVDYFSYLYPKYHVEFSFPAVYTISLFATMGLMVKWGRSYSFGARIVGSFVCFLVAMIAVPLADVAMGEAQGISLKLSV